jgi:hypothetical protein
MYVIHSSRLCGKRPFILRSTTRAQPMTRLRDSACTRVALHRAPRSLNLRPRTSTREFFWQFIFCSCLPACISCVLCGYTERITCRSLKVSPFHKIVERSLCSSCLITCISCVLRADTWRSTCSISGLFVATWYCNHWWFHSGAALTRTWCADWFRVHAQTRAIISSRRPIDPIQSCGVVQRSPQAVFSSREEPFVVILVIYCRASSSSSNSSAGLSS